MIKFKFTGIPSSFHSNKEKDRSIKMKTALNLKAILKTIIYAALLPGVKFIKFQKRGLPSSIGFRIEKPMHIQFLHC